MVCGALAREVKALIDERGWEVDLYGIPALHHLDPRLIVKAVDDRLAELARRHRQVVVVYGDCGTAGVLDQVLARHGATRVSGPHCYEMLAGDPEFTRLVAERPGTFFLTDWLVRSFERAVVRPLGLDRHPDLLPVYFGNYTQVLYLCQFPSPQLDARAQAIADYLGLPLEVRRVGLGQLAQRLAEQLGLEARKSRP